MTLNFPRHNVTVVRRKECIGACSFYEAKNNSAPPKNGGSGSHDRHPRNLLMKATVAATREQARRAEAEVLRRLPEHRNILEMIDSGCSAMENSADNQRRDDDILLDVQRVYCLLFKDCPSRTLKNIIQKHRRKIEKNTRNSGWIKIETALSVFRQMAVAVSVLHDGPTDQSDLARPGGIVHMDIRPEHFAAFKTSRDVKKGCKYVIKLVGAGCAIDGGLPLDYVADRMKAGRLIETTTSPKYRAPEMVNLHLANELTDSLDIWALGCCLYGILFLKDCFQQEEPQNILDGKYEIPHGHPYNNDVIALLARLLSVDPNERPLIHDVISCVDALISGMPLPPRRSKPSRVPTKQGQPEAFEVSHSSNGEKVGRQSVSSFDPSRAVLSLALQFSIYRRRSVFPESQDLLALYYPGLSATGHIVHGIWNPI